MRVVAPVRRPLANEHVIAVDPPLMPSLDAVWRRRINPFTGRSLSDRALTAEQDLRAGMQRLRGLGVSAGVAQGLDVMLEPGARGAAPADAMVQILPGFGLARSGEDAVVATPRRIALGRLPVHARADQLDAIAGNLPAGATGDGEPGPSGSLRPLLPRRIGGALATLLAAPAAADLPRVAVLVAEPVTATVAAGARDSCPPDPRDDPYDDLQRIDGVRLVLSFWPSEQTASGGTADYSLPPAGADRRNRLAYRIFAIERASGAPHPWEAVGVPLALIGFNPDWTLDFVDRASVVRLGGQPKARTPLVAASGTASLWQAQVAQFAEHLSELDELNVGALTATFRQLPPVGFLPAEVIHLPTRRQEFFPAGFGLAAVPVPLEHLDLAIGESAGLEPINLDTPAEIELLVPVPERVYEPGLLETAVIDPAFPRAMARYVADRTDWLVRRELVRRRRDLLRDAVTGRPSAYPAGDLPAEEVLPYPDERAPVTATRVRRTAAGAALRVLQMVGAGSSLSFVAGDRAFLWLRIVDPAGLTGLSLRFGQDTGAAGGSFPFGVLWGSGNQLPLTALDGAVQLRRIGDLPPTGVWTRLEVPANRRWAVSGATLVGQSVDGLDLAQVGGTIEWGPVGKIAADGRETFWVADDAPAGAVLRDSAAPNGVGWPQTAAGAGDPPIESDVGTIEAGGVRSTVAFGEFRARWTQSHSFLAADFAELEEDGIDGFVAAVEGRLRVTNDAIDLGFARARTDTYRVRQYMLGGDAASRLVTSPALADIAARQEGARATSADLADFLKSAYQSDFNRVADNPVVKKEKATTPPPAPAPKDKDKEEKDRSKGGLFFNGLAISQFATFTTTSAAASASKPAATREAPRTASPLFVAVPFTTGTTFATASPAANVGAVRAGPATSPGAQFSIASIAADTRFQRAFNAREVQAQLALPGIVERTVSVAERLPPAPAVEAHEFALAGKYAVINALAGLLGDAAVGERRRGIALADLPAPGFAYIKQGEPPAPRKKNSIGDVLNDRRLKTGEYDDLDEKPANRRHEADYFAAAVQAIDNTVALMRLVEGRIDLYQKLVADAREVRDTLMGQAADADTRLRAIGVELEEARHDLGVATALLAEERDRVAKLNARRRAILDAHVKAIVYRRPRRADRARAIAVAPATAALVEAPAIACLREHDAVPEELREYAGLFRDAALAWFPHVKARLDLIDRLESARAALVAMRLRAAQPFQLTVARPASAPKMLTAVHAIIGAQRAVHETRRLSALAIDVGGAAAAELSSARLVLAQRASLADLIAGDHQRAVLARLAAAEVEGLAQVAGCLHASFGEVPPVVRLAWAELLSEFDRPAPLSELAGLPRWSSLPLELRRQQQGLVDWLFGRIDRAVAPAEAAINELVRVALLLAAHAPVERLIPARLIAPAPARIGGQFHLAVDVTIARIGMTALVRAANGATVAHGVVDDLADGVARARIVRTFGTVDTIATAMTFQLSDAAVR